MKRAKYLAFISTISILLGTTTAARADDPYLHAFTIDPGGILNFTADQYAGDSTAPENFIDTWSGSTGVIGSMSAVLWRKSDGTYSHIQMNDVDIYGDSTIGPSKWFYMSTNWGQTRVMAEVQNLNIKDANVPGNSDVAANGSFLVPDYQSLMYGNLNVYLQYKYLGWFWGQIPGVDYPISENLADHNDPPPQNDLGGTLSGSGNAATLTTTQASDNAIYMNDYAGDYGITADYTINTVFTSNVSASTLGTPTLLLHADAGADTLVSGLYADGMLDASGSYDPQSDTIVGYAWDLDGDGQYNDKSGSSATVSAADLTALGLSFGNHTVGLQIVADDGYWATDELTLTYLPSYGADFNIDGAVDVSDLGILATNYGAGGMTWAQGDANLDGNVDVSDLGILATNYGIGAASVPEPATLSLLSLGALTLLIYRRRK